MAKYYIRERIIFDSYGNCVRGAFNWKNVKCKGKTLFFNTAEEVQGHRALLNSLSKQFEYKICVKEDKNNG